uniref:(northern house mosquito) hypothetical protein n=1 Tax=Culex pipiens TaxID=7175 RepID=A0A8D8K8C4_CULPI
MSSSTSWRNRSGVGPEPVAVDLLKKSCKPASSSRLRWMISRVRAMPPSIPRRTSCRGTTRSTRRFWSTLTMCIWIITSSCVLVPPNATICWGKSTFLWNRSRNSPTSTTSYPRRHRHFIRPVKTCYRIKPG